MEACSMKNLSAHYWINTKNKTLLVYNHNKTKLLGFIPPKALFILINPYIINKGNNLKFKIYFLNDRSTFTLGYLYNLESLCNTIPLTNLAFHAFFVPNRGKCHIFSLSESITIYDDKYSKLKIISSKSKIASFSCQCHKLYKNLMKIDYVKLYYEGWVKLEGYIDITTSISILSLDFNK